MVMFDNAVYDMVMFDNAVLGSSKFRRVAQP